METWNKSKHYRQDFLKYYQNKQDPGSFQGRKGQLCWESLWDLPRFVKTTYLRVFTESPGTFKKQTNQTKPSNLQRHIRGQKDYIKTFQLVYSSEITGAREPEGVWIVSILPRGFCSSEVAVNNDLCFMGA